MELLKERGAKYDTDINALRVAPARHTLYDTAEYIIRWRLQVEQLESKDKKSIDLCIDPIRGEQTWEWLYLLKIAYSDKDNFITKIWELHNLVSGGLYRDTLALSNIISLLAYWNKFGQRPFQYIHCNLRGVLLKDLSQLQFYGSDLTQAKQHKDPRAKVHEDPKLQGAKFVCCLFDKETLLWLESLQVCYLEASCYIDPSEDRMIVQKLMASDDNCKP